MTPRQINLAIAETCGWKPRIGCIGYYRESHDGFVDIIPSYCQDLNAMYDAVEWMRLNDKNAFFEFYNQLSAVQSMELPTWHTTASQRAEAFLRTLGKWVD